MSTISRASRFNSASIGVIPFGVPGGSPRAPGGRASPDRPGALHGPRPRPVHYDRIADGSPAERTGRPRNAPDHSHDRPPRPLPDRRAPRRPRPDLRRRLALRPVGRRPGRPPRRGHRRSRVRPGAAESMVDDSNGSASTGTAPLTSSPNGCQTYSIALERLKRLDLVYPCTCTRAEIARASSAPHADDEARPIPGPAPAGRPPTRSGPATGRSPGGSGSLRAKPPGSTGSPARSRSTRRGRGEISSSRGRRFPRRINWRPRSTTRRWA